MFLSHVVKQYSISNLEFVVGYYNYLLLHLELYTMFCYLNKIFVQRMIERSLYHLLQRLILLFFVYVYYIVPIYMDYYLHNNNM